MKYLTSFLTAASTYFKTATSHSERMASALGGFVSIFFVFSISLWVLSPNDSGILIASIAASAVLLFAVPHGPLSQPWPLFGGHIISALIGITCAQWITNDVIAASLAVGLAIGAMYYLKCIHPPGGATALVTVIGGDSIHDLGYYFILTPILINLIIIFLVAVIYNYFFSWRRYPITLHRLTMDTDKSSVQREKSSISHADFVYALSQIDSFIDVNEYDLLRIYDLATQQSKKHSLDSKAIKLGHYYSNNDYGDYWAVRYVVDESPHEDSDKDLLIYKTVAGYQRRTASTTTRREFARWAHHEVKREEGNWKKV